MTLGQNVYTMCAIFDLTDIQTFLFTAIEKTDDAGEITPPPTPLYFTD